jgi:CRISPR-associated endonuclease/helicase Cas3
MDIAQNIAITPEQERVLRNLLQRHLPDTTAWLYGSRITGKAHLRSDLDMVVFAEPGQERQVSDLREALEESSLPFRVDLFVWDEIPETFKATIENAHVVLTESGNCENRYFSPIEKHESDEINIRKLTHPPFDTDFTVEKYHVRPDQLLADHLAGVEKMGRLSGEISFRRFQMIYAHSLENQPEGKWQPLENHATSVAKLAGEFAEAFSSGEWARLTGILHDLGKARKSFQDYLKRSNGLLDAAYDASDHSHSGAGAVWAEQNLKFGRILAYCIAGHHAGLPDWINGVAPNGALAIRLQEEENVLREAAVAEWLEGRTADLKAVSLRPPWPFGNANMSDLSFWIRMLYSCLVDADFLDTESFMNANKAAARSQYPALPELEKRFFEKLNAKQKSADNTEVNRARAEIRTACERAASLPPGLFSLNVPTGGGKTLSGTAFALRHALNHDLGRIIYVIPYTSIIEQTADILRDFFGKENVVEHHSNFDPDKETQQSRLAAENWDAPIIVTTNVQFFESLYACRSSRCRKLHNIARSVVILDEVQLLPPSLLLPCVEAIRQLVTHYGVSLVLSTATQPALPGLDKCQEIIPPEMDLPRRLKRTDIVLPQDREVRQTWEEIAEELKNHEQVLCVVNTRRDCRDLYEQMPKGTIHLSATMCGEHRSRVIAAIKAMLFAGLPVRVISTQLVEAGVDIDFPVVYRAFTGLSSIAQAAGRCNREGLAKQPGRVVVFMPPKAAPRGELRKAEDALIDLLSDDSFHVESQESYPIFFKRFYDAINDLGSKFTEWLTKDARDFQFQFREAAAAFNMIDDQASATVIVRYGGNKSLIDALQAAGPKRDIMRRLQRYTVNVPRDALMKLSARGFVEEPHPGIYVQAEYSSLYSKKFGLDLYRDFPDAVDLII